MVLAEDMGCVLNSDAELGTQWDKGEEGWRSESGRVISRMRRGSVFGECHHSELAQLPSLGEESPPSCSPF